MVGAPTTGLDAGGRESSNTEEAPSRPRRLAAGSTNALSRALLGAASKSDETKEKRRLEIQQAAAERAEQQQQQVLQRQRAAEEKRRAELKQAAAEHAEHVERQQQQQQAQQQWTQDAGDWTAQQRETVTDAASASRLGRARTAYARLEEKCRTLGPGAMSPAELKEMAELKARLDGESNHHQEHFNRESAWQDHNDQSEDWHGDDNSWWGSTWEGATDYSWGAVQDWGGHADDSKWQHLEQNDVRSQRVQYFEQSATGPHHHSSGYDQPSKHQHDVYMPEQRNHQSQPKQSPSERRVPMPPRPPRREAEDSRGREAVSDHAEQLLQRELQGDHRTAAMPGEYVQADEENCMEYSGSALLGSSMDLVRALCFRKPRQFLLALEAELQSLLAAPRGAVLRLPTQAHWYRAHLEAECARYGVKLQEIEVRGTWSLDIVATDESRVPLPAGAFIPGSWGGSEPSKWRKLKQPKPAKMKQYLTEMVLTPGASLPCCEDPQGECQLQLPLGMWQLVQEDAALLEPREAGDGAVLSLKVDLSQLQILGVQQIGIALCSSGAYSATLQELLDFCSTGQRGPSPQQTRSAEDPFVLLLQARPDARCWLLEFARASDLLEGRPQGRQAIPWPTSHAGTSDFWVAVCPSSPDDRGRHRVEFGLGCFPCQRLFRVGLRSQSDVMPRRFALSALSWNSNAAALYSQTSILGTCHLEPGLCYDRASRDHLVAFSDSSFEEAEANDALPKAELASQLCNDVEQQIASTVTGSEAAPRALIPRAPNLAFAVCSTAEQSATLCRLFNAESAKLQAQSLGSAPGEVPKICEVPPDMFGNCGETTALQNIRATAQAAFSQALRRRQDELEALEWDLAIELGLSGWLASAQAAGEAEEYGGAVEEEQVQEEQSDWQEYGGAVEEAQDQYGLQTVQSDSTWGWDSDGGWLAEGHDVKQPVRTRGMFDKAAFRRMTESHLGGQILQ